MPIIWVHHQLVKDGYGSAAECLTGDGSHLPLGSQTCECLELSPTTGIICIALEHADCFAVL